MKIFRSWWARWKNRKVFKQFDRAVDYAIAHDPWLIKLKKMRRRRIDEIIIEV